MEDFKQFINNIKKVDKPRNIKVSNSYGVYDAYKYYRKNKPKDKKYILTESQYFSIIRSVNTYLGEQLIACNDIHFPCRMGILEVKKYNPVVKFKDGKLINKMPIDWDKTLKLWYEDEESFNNKTLVRIVTKDVFRIYYNTNTANYNNKTFYKFKVNRDLKYKLKQCIQNGNFDAFISKNYG